MSASGLEKSDLGKNRFYSALNMVYPNYKIIGAERVRTFIGYSGWPITLQLPLHARAVPLWCEPASFANSGRAKVLMKRITRCLHGLFEIIKTEKV